VIHTRTIGLLTLTVEPLSTAGHGEHVSPDHSIYRARVARAVPLYSTDATVDSQLIGRRVESVAYHEGIRIGERMLTDAVTKGWDR
jgi:hypothetical protein